MAKIYFAHPKKSIGTYGEMEIKEELKRRGYEVHDPFVEDEKNDGKWFERIKDGTFTYDDSVKLVAQDLGAVVRYDTLLAWLPEGIETFGTIAEIVWANVQEMEDITIIRESAVHPWALVFSQNNLYSSIKNWKRGSRCARG